MKKLLMPSLLLPATLMLGGAAPNIAGQWKIHNSIAGHGRPRSVDRGIGGVGRTGDNTCNLPVTSKITMLHHGPGSRAQRSSESRLR